MIDAVTLDSCPEVQTHTEGAEASSQVPQSLIYCECNNPQFVSDKALFSFWVEECILGKEGLTTPICSTAGPGKLCVRPCFLAFRCPLVASCEKCLYFSVLSEKLAVAAAIEHILCARHSPHNNVVKQRFIFLEQVSLWIYFIYFSNLLFILK